MGKAFLFGNGGGAALNFSVIGSTSQPSSASENTIWINTDTAITSYVFSAAEPSEPENGMIWILTGTSSQAAFSATKKNAIMVCPLSAKQFADGAWVNKPAKSYIGGAWLDWIPETLWLVQNGQADYPLTSYNNNVAVTQNADRVTVTGPGVGYHMACIEGIDLTPYKTMYIEGAFNADDEVVLGVWSVVSEDSRNNRVAYAALSATGAVLDISAVSGVYAVGIGFVYTHSHGIANLYLKQ